MLSREPLLTIEQAALERLAALLLERVGLKITPDGFYGLKLALSSRMPALGLSDAADYVQRLTELAGEHELRSLLPLVTVGKTDFFRDADQFRAIERRLFPEMLASAGNQARKVRVWSAGCATGEEPYSLAMCAIELSATPQSLDIWATDLNPVAVENARQGVFPARRLGGVSPERLKRFFQPVDRGYQVRPALSAFIRFEGQNLAAPVFPKVSPASLDLVLCRNVIIYFDLATIRGLMDRFFEALRPGGVLLLGYSESLFRVYNKFEMFEVEGTFAYRRAMPPRAPAAFDESVPLAKRVSGAPRGALKPASKRVVVAPAPVEPPSMPTGPVARLDAVVAMMDRGEFEAALAAAQQLNERQSSGLDALITLGNIYSLMGRNAESREAFALALSREPLCVEARVFGGVAALQAGALADARAELGKALFLEPTLALGHYLLAQVHERCGDHEAARRSYRNAIAQLRFPQRELAGHYPEIPESVDAMARAAKYALAALQES